MPSCFSRTSCFLSYAQIPRTDARNSALMIGVESRGGAPLYEPLPNLDDFFTNRDTVRILNHGALFVAETFDGIHLRRSCRRNRPEDDTHQRRDKDPDHRREPGDGNPVVGEKTNREGKR